MTRRFDGSPVPRNFVFVLNDGVFAVQWDADRAQEILTGRERAYRDLDFGHAITDYELDQLRDAGRVAHYNRAFVWLNALPEGNRFSRFQVQNETRGRVKRFYLNTTLPIQYLDQVQHRLEELGLGEKYGACEYSGLVAIMDPDGKPFARLAEAESAQGALRRAAPQLLADAAVAFIEFNTQAPARDRSLDATGVLDLDALIASQTETFADQHKVAVGMDLDGDFTRTLHATMEVLGIEFVPVKSGQEALQAVEDMQPSLVLLDLVMPDTHAWEIVAKMRANQLLASIPVIILSPKNAPAEQETFALTVAKVHDYLVKPIAPGRLRQSVWSALKH